MGMLAGGLESRVAALLPLTHTHDVAGAVGGHLDEARAIIGDVIFELTTPGEAYRAGSAVEGLRSAAGFVQESRSMLAASSGIAELDSLGKSVASASRRLNTVANALGRLPADAEVGVRQLRSIEGAEAALFRSEYQASSTQRYVADILTNELSDAGAEARFVSAPVRGAWDV